MLKEELMSRQDDVNSWVEQAIRLMSQKEIQEAEHLLDRALRIVPDHADALLQLGVLYVSTGRGPLATKRLNRAIKESPESAGPIRALGTVLRISGHLELGLQHLKVMQQESLESMKPYYSLAIAEFYAAQGKSSSIREAIQHVDGIEGEDVFRLALLHHEIGDAAGILSLAESQNSVALKDTFWGMAAECHQDFGGAAAHYYNASLKPNTPWFALNALAAMWLNNSEINHCKSYLTEAEELAPNASQIKITKAKLLVTLGHREKARSLLQQIAETQGNFFKTRALAEQLLKQIG
ncbi:MAG: hypothetical protein CMK59_01170 [Proteobacteria bacterium]|nr:hypothetical protein [Pseudomonadota bacterium]